MLPATAKEMASKIGVPFRPDLLQSNDPAALEYQRQLGAAYLQEGLRKTGNLRDALRYYHGGPNRSMWGPKTNAYADAVLNRLGS
jgi:soluble lytic murein transglycosylase-like protein